MSGRHAVRDRGPGRMQGNTLVIDQVVQEEGKPARRRVWRLARSGGNAVTGTISDADGPVTGEVRATVLTPPLSPAEKVPRSSNGSPSIPAAAAPATG